MTVVAADRPAKQRIVVVGEAQFLGDTADVAVILDHIDTCLGETISLRPLPLPVIDIRGQ